MEIKRPGRPSTHVLPRDNGGWIVQQNRNRVWLSDTEAAELAQLLTDNIINEDNIQ